MVRRSKEELLSFGEDSTLFIKPSPPKKKVDTAQHLVVKSRNRKQVDLSTLFFNEPIPPESKKRGPKSKAQLEEEAIITENKRVATKQRARAKKAPKKVGKIYPNVTSPKDCKHILLAFKPFLVKRWELLESGTLAECSTVASYINGAMTICKDNSNTKEYDELYALRVIAKRVYNERNATN